MCRCWGECFRSVRNSRTALVYLHGQIVRSWVASPERLIAKTAETGGSKDEMKIVAISDRSKLINF
jgi:hypothetical protein